jgi:hypothetical protein
VYYVYECEPRKISRDWEYVRIKPGFDVINVVGNARVNEKCPVRIISDAPCLVIRGDARRALEPRIVILVEPAACDVTAFAEISRSSQELVNTGRVVQLKTGVPSKYMLYVDTQLMKTEL